MANKNIPVAVRNECWNCNIGPNEDKGNCYVGCKEDISRANFECGHIISRKNNGKTTLQKWPCHIYYSLPTSSRDW